MEYQLRMKSENGTAVSLQIIISFQRKGKHK